MDPFTEAVLKGNDELTNDDYKTILDGKEQWNDEEKVRFESLTLEGFPAPESDDNSNAGDDSSQGSGNADIVQTPEKPVEPVNDLTKKEESEVKKVQTAEELEALVEKKMKEVAAKGGDTQEQEKKKDEIYEFFKYQTREKDGKQERFIPEEELPKDWNSAFKTLLDKVKENPSLLFTPGIAKHLRDQITDISVGVEQERKDFNNMLDMQLVEMHKENKIPDPNTPEGQVVNVQLSGIAAQYRIGSLTKAYEIWKRIPMSDGGGLGWQPGVKIEIPGQKPVKQEPPRQSVSETKKAAAKIGSSGSGVNLGKNSIPYARLHNMSQDELLEAEGF